MRQAGAFIFSAEILGELNSFYIHVPHWDTVLHTLNGFLCAAVGFALVDMLNREDQFSFKLSPVYLALVALLPEIIRAELSIPFYFGGTSVLIIVSVGMDTIQQIQSHLVAHQYEGLIEKSQLRGKRSSTKRKGPSRR